MLMQYRNGVFVCCNAIHGCNFSGLLNKLKIHEQTCKIYRCYAANCQWSGDVITHIEKMHHVMTDPAVIELKADTYDKKGGIYFVTICKKCSSPNCCKSTPKMLVTIEVRFLNQSNLLQITAISINSYLNLSFGNINVVLGVNFISRTNKISSLLSNMSLNYENSVYISFKLFEQHQSLRISAIYSSFVCGHKI